MRWPFFFLSAVLPLQTFAQSADLFAGFDAKWREAWAEQRLARRATSYDVVAEPDGRRVLCATSQSANAGLVRRFEVILPTTAVLHWRWKVPRSLGARASERSRDGDDYAARVFVVFETSLVPLRTRAINYVWSTREPAGTSYASPYTRNVSLYVIRSGDADAGKWLEESRDVLADYQNYFGEAPTRISAVAVSVDTDNTGSNTKAWFADLRFDTRPAPETGTVPRLQP